MKSPAQFSDVASVLDAALAAGGGLYRLPTEKKAIRWRHRAYSLRALLQRLDHARKQHIEPGTSAYDQMILRIDERDPCVVRIETIKAEGQLTGLDSRPLAPKQTTKLV